MFRKRGVKVSDHMVKLPVLVTPDTELFAAIHKILVHKISGVTLDPATGLLVCDVRLPGSSWLQGRPDMRVTVTTPGKRSMRLRGRDRRGRAARRPGGGRSSAV